MQNVSASTRQSNTTTSETSQLMQHVALLAEQLHDSVHVFKVREERMQQITSGTNHGFPVEKRLDRATLHSSQRITTQPLRRNTLMPADQSDFYPSIADTPTLITEIPVQLQRDYN